jgi:SAM-dependent methyltransferase
MAWPPPLPGRVAWSWLLGTRLRGWRNDRMLRWLDGRLGPNATVVDVGSGPGFVAARLARRQAGRGRRWILIDPQRGMWGTRSQGAVRRALPDAERVTGDAADLPLAAGCADVVLSFGVLCCLSEAAVPGAVAETVRILKPGGWLLLGVPPRRGERDEGRFVSAGFRRVAGSRPGRALLQKAH